MAGSPQSYAGLGGETFDNLIGTHDKQFLVFSSAGKPIYAYHGNEERLSSFMATAEALMSVVSDTRGESLRYIRSGRCVVSFLDRSPLCLVAISTLAEPPAVLRMQLAMVHGQLTSLLTASAVASIFAKSPGYDARRLLGGADVMLRSLIDSFTASPAATLGAYPSLPLPAPARTAAADALRAALNTSNAAFGLVVSGGAVAALAAAGRQQLQQWDVLLLLNFLKSNQDLKQAETFAPICLPTYNPNGHLHAYIRFLDEETGTAVALLVGGASPDFGLLSSAAGSLEASLSSCGALSALQQASREAGTPECPAVGLESLGAALQRAGLGAGCLLHAAYKRTPSQQFVASGWAPAVAEDSNLRRDVVVGYGQLRAAAFDHGGERGQQGPLQALRVEVRPRFVLAAVCSPTYELYLALDCLAGKGEAAVAAGEALRALSARHDILFASDASEFGIFRNLPYYSR